MRASPTPQPPTMHSSDPRSFRVRRVVVAAIAALAGLAVPEGARAQLAIPGLPGIPGLGGLAGPMPVVDNTAVARLVAQLTTANQQLGVVRNNARKLGTYNLRDVNAALAHVELLTRQGEALSYALANVDADFRGTFPGQVTSPTLVADWRVQRTRTLATLRGALNATGASAREVAVGVARLEAMKRQLRGLPRENAQAAAEFNGAVGIHTAEEITLLRQQLAAQGAAQTVYLAGQINREAQAAAAVEDFLRRGAALPARRPAVRLRVELPANNPAP